MLTSALPGQTGWAISSKRFPRLSQMGLFVRTVGVTRATMKIGLANIVNTMRRFRFLERLNASA